jgi:hypothetical protein
VQRVVAHLLLVAQPADGAGQHVGDRLEEVDVAVGQLGRADAQHAHRGVRATDEHAPMGLVLDDAHVLDAERVGHDLDRLGQHRLERHPPHHQVAETRDHRLAGQGGAPFRDAAGGALDLVADAAGRGLDPLPVAVGMTPAVLGGDDRAFDHGACHLLLDRRDVVGVDVLPAGPADDRLGVIAAERGHGR